MIETKRLNIYPASQSQMEAFIAAETDDEMKKAYTEMLEGCLTHPDQWDWYAMWMIELKDGTHIGDLCFKGLEGDGTAEIGYGILDEYQGQGYATEAVRAAAAWAFQDPKVTAAEAETDPENRASQRVLEKCGFVPNGVMGKEGPRFRLNKIMIRRMVIEDYDKVYALWMSCKNMGSYNLDDSREGIEKYLKRNPTTSFLAEQGERVIGVVLSGHDGRKGFIHHMAVAEDHRRQGIASALMSRALDALKEEGINKAGLLVFHRNEAGNAFWEEQGFATRTDVAYRDKELVEMISIHM